jgi:hypothetical protein
MSSPVQACNKLHGLPRSSFAGVKIAADGANASAQLVGTIKKICKRTLQITAFVIIVTAIVVLKSWIWIPHLRP